MKYNWYHPIVNEQGKVTDVYGFTLNQLTLLIPIFGNGNPDGIVSGDLHQRYIDEADLALPVEYIKMRTQINGDPKKGWAPLN